MQLLPSVNQTCTEKKNYIKRKRQKLSVISSKTRKQLINNNIPKNNLKKIYNQLPKHTFFLEKNLIILNYWRQSAYFKFK